MIEVREVPQKALVPIVVTELGMVIEVRFVQPLNPLRYFTEFGIFTEVRLVQFAKAPSLISVTEFGIVIEVRELPAKAPSPIVVTELGMVIEVRFVQPLNPLR